MKQHADDLAEKIRFTHQSYKRHDIHCHYEPQEPDFDTSRKNRQSDRAINWFSRYQQGEEQLSDFEASEMTAREDEDKISKDEIN